jgi:predicted dehydrogenase
MGNKTIAGRGRQIKEDAMTKKVRWLLVGAGAIAGKRVGQALATATESELAAVCDPAVEAARKLAGEYGAGEVYSDFAEALKNTAANAVYIATPVYLHVPQGIAAIEASKHVIVEKPLGLTAADARKLIDAARGTNLKTGCAYYRRFYPAYEMTKKMVNEGAFGKIVLVRMTYYSWMNMAGTWRVMKPQSGGGPLSDMGSHMIDVMTGLLGMPGKVFARTRTCVQQYEVEDSSAIVMELENGADVVASFHWNSKTWLHEFEIVGTEARVKWCPYDSGIVIKTVGRDTEELKLLPAQNMHLPLVENFVEAVISDGRPEAGLDEAVKTNVVLDAIYESSRLGKEVVL